MPSYNTMNVDPLLAPLDALFLGSMCMDLSFWHNMREFSHITFDIDAEVRTSMNYFFFILDSI